jgi:hypothetical protein
MPQPPDSLPRGGRSGLNYDGSPLQFCMSASRNGVSYRLLGDPAWELAEPLDRYHASCVALEEVIALTSSRPLAPLLHSTLALNLPESEADIRQYPDGVMWLAGSLNGPGCAMYVDARRGGAEIALERLMNWLHAISADTEHTRELHGALQRNADLMCLGIEGVSMERARAKVYWRMRQPAGLDELQLSPFCDPGFVTFLNLCLGQRSIRLTGIVLNAGIHIPTGQWADVKLDVCGCRNCLDFSAQEALEVANSLTSAFDLAPLPVATALEYGEIAFWGFGLDAQGQQRINIYFKPTLSR